VASAILKLYCTDTSASGRTYQIHKITSSWTESGITWNNQPSVGSSVNASAPSAASVWWNRTVTDISSLGSTIGFRIKDLGENSSFGVQATFNTRESDRDPILEVTYTYATTISEFQAPTAVYANKYFLLNATINDADGVSDFLNATIEPCS